MIVSNKWSSVPAVCKVYKAYHVLVIQEVDDPGGPLCHGDGISRVSDELQQTEGSTLLDGIYGVPAICTPFIPQIFASMSYHSFLQDFLIFSFKTVTKRQVSPRN